MCNYIIVDASHYRIQDTSAYNVKIAEQNTVKDVTVMGSIAHMAWDRTGKRLAVAFENNESPGLAATRNTVALYAVDMQRKPVRLEPRFLAAVDHMSLMSFHSTGVSCVVDHRVWWV